MRRSLRTLVGRVLAAAGLVATLMLTAAANGPTGLADPALLAGILGLVAVAVIALIIVRRRRGRTVATPTRTEDE
jgi:hypothetical protein